jgi:hypothetical protein
VDAWNSDVVSGNFQLTSHWPNGGITPYNMYDGWLDSSLATGNSATGDYERLNDPAINADLAKLAGAETTAQQTAALALIAQFVAANLPIIPTTTALQWFEYNSQNYTRLAHPGQPLRGRPVVRNQQRSRLRPRPVRDPAPPPAAVGRQQGAANPPWREVAAIERTRATPGT